jgi:DNA polymerase-3 subunit alpha (Gram-positive type)
MSRCNDYYCSIIEKEYEDLKKRRDGISKEYIPSGENKETYFAFLDTLNLSYQKPRSIPKPIPRNEYPLPQKAEGTYFKDFVAFDVETTGIDTIKDSIIELSAVKVKDGKIYDTFSELVRPIDKKIPAEVEQLTGITNDDVKNAREIWEVFPDFAKFIGDNVLVGYNNIAFDSKFLVRAGRYSYTIIQNKHLDVMHFARKYLKQQGINKVVSLVELGKMLGIENPQAHRALADAETTAKIYLKLMESQK